MNSKAKRIIKLRARDIKNTLKQEQTIKELREEISRYDLKLDNVQRALKDMPFVKR